MPALAERSTVIAPCMRGYGDSDKPEQGYNTRTLAADFRQLMQRLGFQQIQTSSDSASAELSVRYWSITRD